MLQVMTADDKRDILARGFTRRSFGRFASLLTAGAARPFYNEFALAQSAQRELREALLPNAVRISGNENPLGPCPEAREAIYNVAGQAGGTSAANGRK
jgi:histidinol-phosphate aminotransferase